MADINRPVILMVASFVGLGVLLTAILLPLSFSRIEYYQYGFLQDKASDEVNTDRVYSGGSYLVGPTKGFKTFTASAHFETLHNVRVFTRDKLEVIVNVTFQYFLKKEDLAFLYHKNGTSYRSSVRRDATDAVKIAFTRFSTRELVQQRKTLEAVILANMRQWLGGRCCAANCSQYEQGCFQGCTIAAYCNDMDKGLGVYVRYLQLGGVMLPDPVTARFMQALTLQMESVEEMFKQEALVENKTTQARLLEIQNEAQRVREEAEIFAHITLAEASNNRTALMETTRKKVSDDLGLNEQELKSSFHYINTLLSLNDVHLSNSTVEDFGSS